MKELTQKITEYYLKPHDSNGIWIWDPSIHLKEVGAVAIKYNVETMDREIFGRACADMDLDFVLASLKDAVDIFGRNRVFSNFIVGLGSRTEL